MKYILSFSILCLTAFSNFAQTKDKKSFRYIVSSTSGDLNNDSIPDIVLVKQDTINECFPYRLEIYFVKKSGEKQLTLSSNKAIAPQYPFKRDGGFRSGDEFAGIEIKKGVLIINMQLLKGNFCHKFRYQKGNFELIGYSDVTFDAASTNSIDFNLSTGIRIEKEEGYRNSLIKKVIKLRPLPKLQDFQPRENKLY